MPINPQPVDLPPNARDKIYANLSDSCIKNAMQVMHYRSDAKNKELLDSIRLRSDKLSAMYEDFIIQKANMLIHWLEKDYCIEGFQND